MTTDEQFQLWFFDSCSFDKDSSQYHWARLAYRDATERAALVCEAIASKGCPYQSGAYEYEQAADECAIAIRGKR